MALVALAGCAGNGGGSGGGGLLFCGPGGTCPAGQTCNAGNVCTLTAADAAQTSDGQAGSDTKQGTETAASDGQTTETPVASDTVVADSAPQDTVVSIDTTIADSPPHVPAGPVAATIAELQTAAGSLTCENPTGVTAYAKVILEPAVVTGPTQLITASTGKKSSLFFVRPATGPTSTENARMAVIVGVHPLPVQPGDVVQITGTAIEFYCLTEITADTADAVVVKGKVAAPQPYDVSMAMLPKNTEPYEDVLLRVSGVVVSEPNLPGNDGKLHGQFVVASGAASLVVALPYGSIYLDKDAKTTLTAGSKFGSIAGHLNYSFGQWMLRPRDDSDLQL